MATQAYYNWSNAGRPWRVAVPIKAIGDRLKAHGYTVYYLGADDRSHLQADFPEDHCPFSVTGWPGQHPYPYVNAGDVMPPAPGQRSNIDGKPLPSLQQLSAQMRADKIAGHPGMAWLKYMNWEPEGDYSGPCYHDSWQPNYARNASSDRGHTHMSGRTDCVTSTASNDYDPVVRARGEESEMGLEQDPAGPWLLWRMEAVAHLLDRFGGGPEQGKEVELTTTIKRIDTNARAAAAKAVPVAMTDADRQAIIAGVVSQMPKPPTAAEVAEELARRISNG